MKTTDANTRNKRADKRQININWNSRLFFQIGVIASLLSVFFIMQTNFEIKNSKVSVNHTTTMDEPPMIDYVLDIEKPKVEVPVKKVVVKPEPIAKVVKSHVFDVKPNTADIIEPEIAATDLPVIETPDITKPVVEEPAVSTGPRTLMNVEFVPVFPGCESLATNNEKIECMSSKINTFINKNFRKEYLENLAPNESHRIYVKFKIDSKGYITEVLASSHNPLLKKEAQRVVNNLPQMKPGKQGDKNVDVLYTVPIVFQIH